MKNYPCYSDGNWIDPASRDLMEVENPATGEIFATVSSSTIQDVEAALVSSQIAQKSWQDTPAFQRGQHIMDVVQRLGQVR